MPILDVKQEPHLPFHFRMIGLFLIIGSVFIPFIQELSPRTVLISFAFVIIGVLMISSRYGLRVDVDKRTYVVYSWILGFRIGKPTSYNSIEKFYINQVTERTTMTFKSGWRSDLRNRMFKAFMLLDNGVKIHVDSDRNENNLSERVEKYIKLTMPLNS